MAEPAKPFSFDTEFGASFRPKEPERKIPLAEHQAEVAASFERGVAQGRAEALESFERACALSLDAVSASLARLSASLTQIETRLEIEAVDVAIATARKLAAGLVARHPLDEIEALALSNLRELRTAPHLLLRLHPDVAASAAPRMEEVARLQGFEGRLVILPDPEIALGDGRIEWADGGVVRNTAAVEAGILNAVNRYLNSRAQDAGFTLDDHDGDGG